MTSYFCDGLNDVTVINGVVRLEFHRLDAVQRGQNRELRIASPENVPQTSSVASPPVFPLPH